MALLTKSQVLSYAATGRTIYESATDSLVKLSAKQSSIYEAFDIFLSHSFQDRDLILGVANLLTQKYGYSVYLDWRDDPLLDRENVNKHTATLLRYRISQSKCLLFATTENSSGSKWMPWELGYKDAHNQKAAILPIADSVSYTYEGQEYLGIYPHVWEAENRAGRMSLYVQVEQKKYCTFGDWMNSSNPTTFDS